MQVYIEQWWVSGDESCVHCGGSYCYEMELRCPDCDGPTCAHCLVIYSGRRVCPECVGADDGLGEES